MTPGELAWPTPRAWAERVLEQPLALLSDHAHCELGAAAASTGLLARRPEDSGLVERLAAHAAEELRHFRLVHRRLRELGGRLGPLRRSPYAEGLLARVERGPRNLLDRLLVAAVIEGRSLERFRILGEVARERAPALEGLYAELEPSEAGHAALFLELARAAHPEVEVASRHATWLAREAELLSALPFAVRVHSGPPLPSDSGASGEVRP